MPDTSYNVVFEYDETMGGLYGVRTWTSYTDQAEFEKIHTSKGHPGNVVVAQGITQDEALDLTSLTPEICRLMGAIEQVFSENPDPSQWRINYTITNAKYAIAHDRKFITEKSLARQDATKYIAHFKKLIKANQLTPKSACMSTMMLMCFDNQGQVL